MGRVIYRWKYIFKTFQTVYYTPHKFLKFHTLNPQKQICNRLTTANRLVVKPAVEFNCESFWHSFLQVVGVIHTTTRQKKHENVFLYGEVFTLIWDPDYWRWLDDHWLLQYTTGFNRDSIINKVYALSHVVEK